MACMYFAKPPAERQTMPRSQIAAHVNCWTCVVLGSLLLIALIVSSLAAGDAAVQQQAEIEYCKTHNYTEECIAESNCPARDETKYCETLRQTSSRRRDPCTGTCYCYEGEHYGRRRGCEATTTAPPSSSERRRR